MRRSLILSALASICLLESSIVLAGEVHPYPQCQKQPTDAEVQGAKGAFQAGSVSFNEADYDRAIMYWEDAFRRDCTATLLLHHLSRAYEGKGNLEQAVVALKTYLERTPEVSDRPQILRRIEVFEQKIDAEHQRQSTAAQESKPPKPETEVIPVEDRNESAGFDEKDLYVNPIIPITVAGVGLAATIVGSIIYFPAHSDVKDYKVKCPNNTCDPPALKDEANAATARQDWGTGVGVTGLILAIGGGGWYLANEMWFKPRPAAQPASPRQAVITPWLAPQSAGLSWRGSF